MAFFVFLRFYLLIRDREREHNLVGGRGRGRRRREQGAQRKWIPGSWDPELNRRQLLSCGAAQVHPDTPPPHGLERRSPPELSNILGTVSSMLLAGCRLLLPLLSKAARDGRARSSDCLDPATGGEAAGAGSSVWGEQAVAQEPGLAPPWGPPLKLAGNPHTAGTERRRET